MSHVLVLASRELRERRNVLLAGLCLGLIGLPLPLLFSNLPAESVRGAYLFLLLLCFTPAVAVLVGSSVIGRDLNERRLGFYFTRPVSGPAIVAGKLLGGLLLVAGSTLALVVPLLVAGSELFELGLSGFDAAPLLGWFAVATFIFVLLGHTGAVATRSRSAWLALDVAVLAGAVATGVATGQRLARADAVGPMAWTIGALGGGFFLALAAAAVVALLRERTDHRRVHRTQSLVLAAVVGPLALGAAAYAHWVLTPGPGDFAPGSFVRPSAAGWIGLDGRARSASAGLLWEPASGRVARHSPRAWLTSFSPDGRRAAWVEPDRKYDKHTLVLADLTAARPEPTATGVVFDQGAVLAFSPDGTRLAALSGNDLQVLELPSLRLLASARVDSGDPARSWGSAVRFVDSGRVRAWIAAQRQPGQIGGRTAVADLDVAARRVELTGGFDLPRVGAYVISADASRVLAAGDDGPDRVLALLDGRSGERIAVLARTALDTGTRAWLQRAALARFTADGRPVTLERRAEGAWLRVFDRDGVELHALDPFPGQPVPRLLDGFDLGIELRPGLLAVGTRPGAEAVPAALSLVDLGSGSLRRQESGLSLRAPTEGGNWMGMWVNLHTVPWALERGAFPLWADGSTLVAYDPDDRSRQPLFHLGGVAD